MSSSMMQIVTLLGILITSSLAEVKTKVTVKRGIPSFGLSSFSGGFDGIPIQDLSYGFSPAINPQPISVFVKTAPPSPPITLQNHLSSYQPPIPPSEIASALTAAKEASSRVQYLQSRVQAAKDTLLEQQQLAKVKEAAAAAALQRSEAAAAAQRQAASAAATAVVAAQQKLAEAKAEVAEQQRIAAMKELYAAEVIRKSASAAAAEIQRTEDTAAKIAALQRSEAAAAIQHVTATKDATLSATTSAVAAANNLHVPHPSAATPGPQFSHPIKYHPWN